MIKIFLSLLFLCSFGLQGQLTTVDLGNQGRNADFRAFPYVYPVPQGASLPLTCTIGQGFYLTDVFPNPTSGALYTCSTTNTWTQAGGNSGNATSILSIPITVGATNGQVLSYNSGTNHWTPTTPSGTTYSNGTGILLSTTTFSLDTSYTDAHYHNLGNVNTWTQQSTPGVAPSAGSVKIYAKTGTNQICTYNSSGTESCSSTGTSSPGGASNSFGYNNGGAFGGFINASATKGYAVQTNSGTPTFQLVPIPVADGGTGAITANAGFNNLSPFTTIGDFLYGGVSGAGTRLAGNTTTTPQVIISTGTGSAAQAPTLGPFVSTVNGQSGAVTVATGNFQTWIVNSSTLTNRAKAVFTGTGGTTVSSTDNGSDTQTITFNSSSTATPTSSGTTLPSATCNAASLGNLYTRTGVTANTNSSGMDFFVCSNTASGYRWALTKHKLANVMSYGCKADGLTDDSTCINNAIADVSLMTHYTVNGGTGYYGGDLFFPNGKYEIGSPIILQRNGSTANGTVNGIVSLIGESPTGVIFEATGSFPIGATSVFLTAEGSGYSGTPTVTFGAGCSGTPVATVIVSKNTYIGKVYVTSAGTSCTSMPSCTIVAGGGGSGATCQTVGRGMIEWSQSQNMRIVGQVIRNITFLEPKIVGSMAIHKQDIGRPDTPSSSGTHLEDERFEELVLENINYLGSNQYNPLDMFMEGDCYGCMFKNIGSNPAQGSIAYSTVMLGTDVWMQGNTTDENAGFNFSDLSLMSGGGARGGYAAAFQGRIGRSHYSQVFCNGQTSGITNNQCYGFYNSGGNTINSIANEGTSDNPQILFFNSNDNFVTEVGIGAPIAGAGDGMDLVASSGNQFSTHLGGNGVTFQSIGKFEVSVDANSINNQFRDWQANGGTAALSVSDLTSNFFQLCDSNGSPSCTSGGFKTYGYVGGVSMNGATTQPTCNANTRGALWPVRNGSGVADHVQACLQTGSGTTVAWTTIF